MTRSAWVTVRLPGARTAPPTSTRIWFQTGAVKHGRKTASQDTRIVGTVGWAVADSMRFCVIESGRINRPRSRKSPQHARTIRLRRLCGWLLGYDLTANPMKLRKVELKGFAGYDLSRKARHWLGIGAIAAVHCSL